MMGEARGVLRPPPRGCSKSLLEGGRQGQAVHSSCRQEGPVGRTALSLLGPLTGRGQEAQDPAVALLAFGL